MARYERLKPLFELLWLSRQPQSMHHICERLQASRATVNRLISYLREELGLDVRYTRDFNGYYLNKDSKTSSIAALMGLTYSETTALLEALILLEQIPPGIVRNTSIEARTAFQRLTRHNIWANSIAKFIEIRLPHQRKVAPRVFAIIVDALRESRQIVFTYKCKRCDFFLDRTFSPIRLVHYRSNWYLACWSHVDNAIQIFSLDSFSDVRKLEERSYRPPLHVVEQDLDSTYGVFIGKTPQLAILRFSPAIADCVAAEQWHRDAKSERCPDGSVRLRIPYGSEKELVKEILGYGADCQVEGPESLRRNVALVLRAAVIEYEDV